MKLGELAVLIIEPNPNAKISMCLDRVGVTKHDIVYDGDEAVARFNERHYPLVICGTKYKGRITGPDAIKKLRSQGYGPIVVGLTMEEDGEIYWKGESLAYYVLFSEKLLGQLPSILQERFGIQSISL